jgi:hypothetical protein
VEQVFDRVAAVTADSMLLALLVAGIAMRPPRIHDREQSQVLCNTLARAIR